MNPRVQKSGQENMLIIRLFNEGQTGELSFNEIQDFVNDEVSMRQAIFYIQAMLLFEGQELMDENKLLVSLMPVQV